MILETVILLSKSAIYLTFSRLMMYIIYIYIL